MQGGAGIDEGGRKLGGLTGTLLVIASMVGTGVFTTTGILLPLVSSPLGVLIAWSVGGLFALCGALSYAELAAVLPRNGGEYRILSRVYHPAAGFAAGWVSLLAGFSAPMAAAALGFGRYLSAALPIIHPVIAAVLLIAIVSAVHAFDVSIGGAIQNVVAALKVALLVAFAAIGIVVGTPDRLIDIPARSVQLLSPAFAVALVLVSFSYSGWNAAVYLAGEIRRPGRNLPWVLLLGTSTVVLLYVGLNAGLLAMAPVWALEGVVEVASAAASYRFGAEAARVVAVVIALALISSTSAMAMAGPRVYQAMGEDYPRLSALGRRTSRGAPVTAVMLQALVAVTLVLTSSFEAILAWIGFTLSLSSGLTVIGVIVLRWREPALPRPYRVWGYPLPPLLFALMAGWMVVHTLVQRPVAALAGLATIVTGVWLHGLVGARDSRAGQSSPVHERKSIA